jgi:hypothetical protein
MQKFLALRSNWIQRFLPLNVVTEFRNIVFTTERSNWIQKYLPLYVVTEFRSVYYYA